MPSQRSIPVFVLALALAGCGGSKFLATEPVSRPESPMRLMATMSASNDFSTKLIESLSALGYGILDQGKTDALLQKLDLDSSDLSDPTPRQELKSRRIDGILKIAIETPANFPQQLTKVNASVNETQTGALVASVAWSNSWGGMAGSPVDGMMKMSAAAAARQIAQALARQLGAPGPKTSVYMDDVIAARKARLSGVAAVSAAPPKPEPVSDVDVPSARLPERPDDFALIIGIEEYQSVPKADYGARDAKTVQLHLRALGFPARNIVSLLGPEATASKLRGYLEEWLPLNVTPASTLFVYYSGHGAPDVASGDAYLVPWDGDPKFLKSTALPLKKVYADLSKTKAKRVIVALDACFSGAGGRSVLAKGARPLVTKVEEAVPASANMIVLAAASGDEITGSLDEQGHGMFTYHLLKGLAAEPRASAERLFQYVTTRVQEDARRQNRVQTPVLAGETAGPLLEP